MKRSTRVNFSTLIKDELVKRFESITREEIRRHNLAIEETNRKIDWLTDEISRLKTENEMLKSYVDNRCKQTENKFHKEKSNLESSFEDQRRSIRTDKSELQDILNKIEIKTNSFVTQKELELVIDGLVFSVDDFKNKCCVEFEDLRKELYKSSNDILLKITCKIIEVEKKINILYDSLNDTNKTISINIVDVKGIYRDFNVFKKSLFVLEKKIEHLFTLSEKTCMEREK